MKFDYTNTSPFTRIARLAILELDIVGRLEMAIADPWTGELGLYRVNPLEKVPALELDGGRILVNSLTSAEYLGHALGGNRLLPVDLEGCVAERHLGALGHGITEVDVARLIGGGCAGRSSIAGRAGMRGRQILQHQTLSLELVRKLGKSGHVGAVEFDCLPAVPDTGLALLIDRIEHHSRWFRPSPVLLHAPAGGQLRSCG